LTGKFSAQGAAVGARTIKTGQSRWFVGYKKHTLRLWLPQRRDKILLVPLVSWAAPANRNETRFVKPSVELCLKRLHWMPDLIVGDMAYVNLELQKDLRERLGVGFLTKIRSDMKWAPPFDHGPTACCPQGQPLNWLELDGRQQLHWFGVTDTQPLCQWCWQQSTCARQFSYPAHQHEILLGRIPLTSRTGQVLLNQVRCWIEPAQSFEKNQLGLNQMFFNSLRFTWVMCLLADAAVLLRAHALLQKTSPPPLLRNLMPSQLSLGLL